MDQLMKSEVIIGLISTAKSMVVSNIYSEKKKKNPNHSFLKSQQHKLKTLDGYLDRFYQESSISDDNFSKMIQDIKNEINIFLK